MPLKLYFHPLASYCWKALIALYETETPFEPHIVDLGSESQRAELKRLWPVAKFPVLRDDAKDRTVPEATIIIEYLARHYPGKTTLLPPDPNLALETRLRDRFYDLYVHEPMQKIVGDRIRPQGKGDPYGAEQARVMLTTAYEMVEREARRTEWAMGDTFSLADCAAAPALYYANRVHPLGEHKNAAGYLNRLLQRPSFARVMNEAEPYFSLFPG